MAAAKIRKFDGIIRGWYEKNSRELPWRLTTDPYAIWLSEVILQQTRVDQGLKYYNSILEAYPDIHALARAEEDDVLKLWQGLGYYSRARNLHHAARYVSDVLEGQFPDHSEGLKRLRGIGEYTASAIASICFGEKKAVVDGNVSRVIARLYGIEEPVDSTAGARAVATQAGELMEEAAAGGTHPGIHNQAMMEFGALQCIPASPDCRICPLNGNCNAYHTGRVDLLPVKRPKRKPSDRWFSYYVISSGEFTILQKRGNGDIWRSLYQFPMVESDRPQSEPDLIGKHFKRIMMEMNSDFSGRTIKFKSLSPVIRHQLTHQNIHARFIHVEIRPMPRSVPVGYILIPAGRFSDYPVPRLIQCYMESGKISYL